MSEELKEKLAKLAHEQWSGWVKYMFRKCIPYDDTLIIPKWAVDRWGRQSKTEYCKLSEGEKDSDRIEADRFLAVFQATIEIKGLKEQIRIMKIENKTLLTALKQEQALSQKEPQETLTKCPKCNMYGCQCDKKTIDRHEMDKQVKKDFEEHDNGT